MFRTTLLAEIIKDITEAKFCAVSRLEPNEFVVYISLLWHSIYLWLTFHMSSINKKPGAN